MAIGRNGAGIAYQQKPRANIQPAALTLSSYTVIIGQVLLSIIPHSKGHMYSNQSFAFPHLSHPAKLKRLEEALCRPSIFSPPSARRSASSADRSPR